jgi:DNA-directed RNA polymerase specialized sigma24 family protein
MRRNSENIPAEYEHTGASDLHVQEVFADVRGVIAAYLNAAVHGSVDRQKLLAEAMAATFIMIGPNTTLEATIVIALNETRRIAAGWKRLQRREVPLRVQATETTVSNRAFREELWAYEDELLKRLSNSQRAALELHEMDGLSDREIALRVGCSARSLPELRRRAKIACRTIVNAGVVPPPPFEDDPFG